MRKQHFQIIELRDIASSNDLSQQYIDGIAECVGSAFGGGISPEDGLSHMQGDQLLIGLDSDNNVAGQLRLLTIKGLNTRRSCIHVLILPQQRSPKHTKA